MYPQTWTRVLGLSTRAVSLTAQRMLDVWSIGWCLLGTDGDTHDGIVLTVGLVLTTVLMAFTMCKHWSGLRRQGRPHGPFLAVFSSVIQIAPVVEMLDKVLSHQMPICFSGDRLGPHRAPLLKMKTTVAKGSPGENAMRGVRKLSMVNLPQAGLSLWYHIGRLVPRSAHLVAPQHPTVLACAFVASFFSLSFGIADFVLYVWVDDAFVRENKKLVTFHYCVEILMRLPMLVLFHLCGKEWYGYRPIAVVFAVDVLTTTLLLSWARFSQSRRKCCCLPGTQHCVTQGVFYVIISVPLFFVNLVFCDPGMGFFYVNQVYYAIKYCELMAMWLFVSVMRQDRRRELEKKHEEGGESVLDLSASWFQAFTCMVVGFAVLNAVFVWVFVPNRRRKKDERLIQGTTPSTDLVRMSTDPVEAAIESQPSVGAGGGRCSTLLGNLEGIFELLMLLSSTHVAGNREMLLKNIVENLWYEALPWSGTFDDGAGGTVSLAVNLREHVVLVTPHGLQQGQRPATLPGKIVHGALVLHDQGGTRRGRFDSRVIRWDSGEQWTKRSGPSGEDSQAVLKLILPQLALALKWDLTAEGCVASPDLEAQAEGSRPLLCFLVAYAFATAQADVISDLYWALVCLSQEEEGARVQPGEQRDLGYRSSRIALLKVVRGELPDLLPDCGSAEDIERFLHLVRRMLQGQREVWQQNMELILNHSGRWSGGSGSWSHRTEAVRDALRRWRELHKSVSRTRMPDMDEELLRSPRNLSKDRGGVESPVRFDMDMVSPEDESSLLLSLPIDPTLQYRGIVIDETEVIPSKQAPLLLTCRTRGMRSRLISSPHQSPGGHDGGNEEIQEKYLLKVGDDLRQDQLMLQMMALMSCVWQERLPPEEARLLQIANFRALAVTPQAGYVKFVAESVALSDALHESHGNLYKWLEQQHVEGLTLNEVLDNFCGSVAACCVVTYILGIGDRHLENLCITRRGQLFHVDFGFILGDDPKPMAPPVRLPQQVAQALLMSDRLNRCFTLAGRAYLELRPLAGLWTSILKLIAATGGSGCPRLARQSMAAISGLRERLRVDQQDEERAASEFLCLMRESSEGMASILIDKVHAAGLFWR